MNPYAIAAIAADTPEAATLSARLVAWHDEMVAHERRLRSNPDANLCGDECPHAEANALWVEASAVLGAKVSDLTFLRSRALGASTRQGKQR